MSREVNPFDRQDPAADTEFYAWARKVTHIEAGAIEALRSHYAEVLPKGGDVLDLMSSWRSHLPDGLGDVTGLGLNAEEMADNPQLTRFDVWDLNATGRLPYDDASFDAVVCAVSVQYLTRPVEVFGDVRRVLRPGGPVVVSFSNRCFPTKAVAVWLAGDDDEHLELVAAYLHHSGFAEVQAGRLPSPDDPLYVVEGRAPDS